MNSITAKGVVHGRTIELEQEPGLPDGQIVSVVLQPQTATKGEGLLRAFGGWADDAEGLDEFLKEMRRSRDLDVGREIEE